jgi:hypothetical protein
MRSATTQVSRSEWLLSDESEPRLLAASDHGVVTVDIPRSARAPLRSGAHLTLYKSRAHPPSRAYSLEGRALLFCGTHCARQIPSGPRVLQGNAQVNTPIHIHHFLLHPTEIQRRRASRFVSDKTLTEMTRHYHESQRKMGSFSS